MAPSSARAQQATRENEKPAVPRMGWVLPSRGTHLGSLEARCGFPAWVFAIPVSWHFNVLTSRNQTDNPDKMVSSTGLDLAPIWEQALELECPGFSPPATQPAVVPGGTVSRGAGGRLCPDRTSSSEDDDEFPVLLIFTFPTALFRFAVLSTLWNWFLLSNPLCWSTWHGFPDYTLIGRHPSPRGTLLLSVIVISWFTLNAKNYSQHDASQKSKASRS